MVEGIVNILDSNRTSCGTGFFSSPEGHIITCSHVLKNAGYGRTDDCIFFREAEDKVRRATWCFDDAEEDIAVLQATDSKGNREPFFELCNLEASAANLTVYGFPNKSNSSIQANVTFDCLMGGGKRMQIGNANSVTTGFSGAPLLYENRVAGLICQIAKADENGRLQDVAFAIPASTITSLCSSYTQTPLLCKGYGKTTGRCGHFPFAPEEELCEGCYTQWYKDEVISLYKAQKYEVKEHGEYFTAKLQYGPSLILEGIVVLVKFHDEVSEDELVIARDRVGFLRGEIRSITVVTNAVLSKAAKRFARGNGIQVHSRESLLQMVFDLNPYLEELSSHVHSEVLSGHYIDVDAVSSIEGKNKIFENFLYELFFDELFYKDENEADLRREPLKDYVQEFLSGSDQALLILGDYGSGKTSFCYTFAYELLQKYLAGKSGLLPIMIRLRGYNKAADIKGLITDYFVNDLGIANFNIASFNLLLRNLRVVLIFDGYDEVAKKVDFDVKYEVLKEIAKYAIGDTKIILTCRPNFFQDMHEFKDLFAESHLSFEPEDAAHLDFLETMIADLTPAQTLEYLKSYEMELKAEGITIDEMVDLIHQTHDLTDLSKRPFLLYMIQSTLPDIIKDIRSRKRDRIHPSMLYESYTDKWILREDNKNKTLIKREDKVFFCRELAYSLYSSDSTSIPHERFPDTIKAYFKNVGNEEDVRFFIHDIESCSFLTSDRSGEFQFIHKSFMEYFVADRIAEELAKCGGIVAEEDLVEFLNQLLDHAYLSMETCSFIVDNEALRDIDLCDTATRCIHLIGRRAVQNLISIVVATGVNMAEIMTMDGFAEVLPSIHELNCVQLHDCVIEDNSFFDMAFYKATIERVVFRNCTFSSCAFSASALSEVGFYDCDLYGMRWKESLIQDSIMKECSLIENRFLFTGIKSTEFIKVDFSRTDTTGCYDANDVIDPQTRNRFEDCIGIPRDFTA
ncbi:MAG: trypsin-like peptidase domain-containing protein [Clostridiales Family XIII bacterium]|jgi:uncharacterized protein YjbI with pentapeptide repeats|nr:trypsin-like peptidase domain-containing protein [Clostridiales Family XIII bacterium]